MQYFKGVATIAEAHTVYRQLMQEHHPDHGGSEDVCKAIIAEYEYILPTLTADAFSSYEEESGRTVNADSDVFWQIIRQISSWNMRIEVIGYWIYCFDSYEYRAELKAIGFWFSSKHKAWCYSGRKKARARSRYTTDQIREKHGSHRIEREEVAAIA